MSFREDMKDIQKTKIELIENRKNIIDEENYKKLYNYFASIMKEKMIAGIKNRYINYDSGFFSKKNPRYEDYYGICIIIYPDKIEEFQTSINIYDKRSSGIYGGDEASIYLETCYLDDVKKSLLYLLENLKSDDFDHVLIAEQDTERYLKSGYIGKEFLVDYIDYIITNLQEQWRKNVEAHYTLRPYVRCVFDIIVQIECDWDGNIT